MAFAFFSLSSCLEEVPVEIKEWKPEHAPQATVIKRAGNNVPMPVFQPVNAGMAKFALPVKAEAIIPIMARAIIA